MKIIKALKAAWEVIDKRALVLFVAMTTLLMFSQIYVLERPVTKDYIMYLTIVAVFGLFTIKRWF